jgi:MFS family permease
MTSLALRLGLRRRVAALAAGLFVFALGEELWSRYLPEYLRAMGASALALGAFGTLRDFLDAAYSYPGGWLSDRLGSRRALLLFGAMTAAGLLVYLGVTSVAGVFVGVLLVASWKSLGLPATFTIVGEELQGGRRIVGFTVQAIVKRLPIVIAPPLGGILIERLGIFRGMKAGFAVSFALAAAMLVVLGLAFREKTSAENPPLPHASGRSIREMGMTAERSSALPTAEGLSSVAGAVAAGADGNRGEPPRASRRGEGGLHPTLRRLLVADCLIRLCEGLPDVFLVVWALEIVRVSPAQFGLLVSIMMAASILSYFPAAMLADRVEKKPFVVATFLFFTLFPVAVVAARDFGHLAAAYVIGGLREIGEPARKALIVDLSAFSARGRTVGLYYAIRGFAVAGAAAIGGALWTIRPSLTFFTAGALGAAGTLWTILRVPEKIPADSVAT